MKRSLLAALLLLFVLDAHGQSHPTPGPGRAPAAGGGGGASLAALNCTSASTSTAAGDCGSDGCIATVLDESVAFTVEYLARGEDVTAVRPAFGLSSTGPTLTFQLSPEFQPTNDPGIWSSSWNAICDAVGAQDDTTWHRWSWVHNTSSPYWELYVDGVSCGTFTASNFSWTNSRIIWACGQSGGSSTSRAYITDLRIWNDVRTSTEVADHAFCQVDPASAGLELYWDLTEGTGTAAESAGGTGSVALTLSGAAAWVTACERGSCTGVLDELDTLMDGGALGDGADCL